ncbi:nonstructural protein [Microviridae sp.]|nr:nonstructural protein [Microviridae sp.]
MILKIFAVYDSKVEGFANPFYAVTRGQAVRMFQDSLDDERSPFSKHPEDYSLFFLGQFNDANGVLDNATAIEKIISAIDFKQEK